MNPFQNKKGFPLEIFNTHFSDEMIFNESIQCSSFGDITFLQTQFKNVDFLGSNIISCNFQNCDFKDVIFRKCSFWNSNFENCNIQNSNLSRAEFYNVNFQNCNFQNVNLKASSFFNSTFSETTFKTSNLQFIEVESIKISNLKQLIEIEESSNFELILKDLNLIISPD